MDTPWVISMGNPPDHELPESWTPTPLWESLLPSQPHRTQINQNMGSHSKSVSLVDRGPLATIACFSWGVLTMEAT